MIPDPSTLMADSARDPLLDNQAPQRISMREEIATLTAQATATAACFNILITGHLHTRKSGASRRRLFPDGMISIGRDLQVEALAARIEFVPQPYETVPADRIEDLELRRGERADAQYKARRYRARKLRCSVS
jgi:hypothetical protein